MSCCAAFLAAMQSARWNKDTEFQRRENSELVEVKENWLHSKLSNALKSVSTCCS